MAAITEPFSAVSSAVTVTGFSTLANNTYCVSNAIDVSAIDPTDEVLEVSVTVGTVSGVLPGVQVFLKSSLDNSTFSSGPESGTSATDESQLIRIGFIPTPTSSATVVEHFSIRGALDFVPPYHKVVFRNISGAALTAASLKYATKTGNV